jgi:hypothetical protein
MNPFVTAYHEYNNINSIIRTKNQPLSYPSKEPHAGIIGVDYPALREQLFLAEGLSTEQLEARILEGTERLDFERAQNTYRASQEGNSDAISAD